MPSGPGEHYDFFLSRRGSVAAIAREVADVLAEKGYKVLVQDYDIPLGASFIEAMREAVKNARDLIILFTGRLRTVTLHSQGVHELRGRENPGASKSATSSFYGAKTCRYVGCLPTRRASRCARCSCC
jgi:hypothetical protein